MSDRATTRSERRELIRFLHKEFDTNMDNQREKEKILNAAVCAWQLVVDKLVREDDPQYVAICKATLQGAKYARELFYEEDPNFTYEEVVIGQIDHAEDCYGCEECRVWLDAGR